MIDSVTLFTKENQRDLVNAFILSVLLGEGKNVQASSGEGPRREILSRSNQSPVVVEWLDGSTTTAGDGASSEERRNWIALAVYPEVAIRKLHGVDALLSSLMRRYALYYEHHCKKIIDQGGENPQYQNMELAVPPPQEFDSAFQTILRRFQDQLAAANTSSTSISSLEKRHNNNKSNKQQSQNVTKKGKEKTVWHDGKQKITKAALAELDMSKDKDDTLPGTHGTDGIREDARAIAEAKAAYMPTEGEKPAWEEEDEVLDDSDMNWNIDNQGDRDEEDNSLNPSWKRGFFSKLLSPNSPLTKSDLDSPLKQMQLLLTSKNVAPSTAQAICEIVEKQLIGKRVGTLVGVKRAVRHALEDAVERILRPELGGVGGRAGVTRGVGKSTSLAKIAYYLQSNRCTPLLAACDTFRSGAVEQLSVHASCLSIPLYHQGYAKDPSAVAKAAISKAADDGNDVVLIDTAGRMQNNLPLMKALAKLVFETQPDSVLFVCEALVGNDGMDQLTMFQKALTSGGHSRPIDGIVLTKFDTVSDKVGAALTLTHSTGVPIAFCGTGQKYNHLKPLGVPFVIHSLFS
ncbi:hypothetical protein ACHAXA_000032 [Cyclostephanos tholiformis]|uniref:Signal recognition particle receptor subunit alpha homolog n=1 Tax=Cyclostephanos tholiformis TaxID=382380 RepID=A0ABD3SRR8_9STRA